MCTAKKIKLSLDTARNLIIHWANFCKRTHFSSYENDYSSQNDSKQGFKGGRKFFLF